MQSLKLMLEYTQSLKVLYVEDDTGLIQRTQELFEHYFSCVDIAYDGVEGFERYKRCYLEHDSFYDLVITDIKMPHMDGIELSEKIYEINNLQSILIISAHDERDDLSRIVDLGVSGFITKPVQNFQLVNTLFKIARAIHDNKFVEEHIGKIESLNIQLDKQNVQLELQNEELLKKNLELEKSFRMLDTMVHKEQLSNSIQKSCTREALNPERVYVEEQIEQLIHDDLNELVEIHGEIDNDIIGIINHISSIDTAWLDDLVELFTKYSSILSFYNFFSDLSMAMKDFALILKDNPLPTHKETVKNIFMLLESFMYVLGKWQDDLKAGDTSKINSFDDSIISDMRTITNMWIQKEEVVSDDVMDDIFNF